MVEPWKGKPVAVGIVGYGFVGHALEQLFGVDQCRIYDPAQGFGSDGCRHAVNQCEVTFVNVPTPAKPDGQCDTSIVEEAVTWIKSPVIVIRSTVAPGTTDRLTAKTGKRIVFQPEYVGETAAHPLLDHKNQPFAVLGGRVEDTAVVAELYKRVYHSDFRFCFTSALCAELAKYMENAFYAVKVMFCHEFMEIANAFGVDYNELREAWLMDPRISRDHTWAYPTNPGFSGKCLPKDMAAIIYAAKEQGVTTDLLTAAFVKNIYQYRRGDPICSPFDLAACLFDDWTRPQDVVG